MKYIDFGILARTVFPDGSNWEFEGESQTLRIFSKKQEFEVAIQLLDRSLNDVSLEVRANECHNRLNDSIQREFGSATSTSIESINGHTWTGYQAVTALEDGQFQVNRIIVGLLTYVIFHVSFKIMNKKICGDLLSIIEGIEVN